MKLYICLTYYHCLITLIKSLVNKEKYSLLIANDIPGFDELRKKMEMTGCFSYIYDYDAIRIRNRPKCNNKLAYLLTDKKSIVSTVEKYCKLDFNQFDEIYLYHDLAEIGSYFIIKHIKYHLLEDALDYFKYFDKYYSVKPGSYKKGTFGFFLKSVFGIGYKKWGTSKECIDIEVNDLNGILIDKEKCFEIPRKKLFNKMTYEDHILVYNTFAAGKRINDTNGLTAIICTQPLYLDHFVSSLDEQKKVFEAVIIKLMRKNYHIVIKPHPRDSFDYSVMTNNYDVEIIDKNLPSEILNFNPKAKYDIAISITSTAINFLEYASEKVFLGREFIEEVLNNAV